MNRRRALAAASAAQLAVGVAGMKVAIDRGHPYHVPLLHGRVENLRRDCVLMGTALSAPVVMLAAQGTASARLVRGESPAATKVLGGLGAVMVAGYLAERLVRTRLRPAGWERVESPLLVVGVTLAAVMAALGLGDS